MAEPDSTGYVAVNGMDMYWESRGEGGTPVVVVHGGFGLTSMFGDLLDQLAHTRRVVAIELQGHGHTGDIDRAFSYEAFGDDIAGVIRELSLGQADLLGYSLGAGACLRAAIQHPDSVRRLALLSTPCRKDGWFAEVREGMLQVGRASFEQMKQSPTYEAWRKVAPDPNSFPSLMDKTGDLLRQSYDWADEVKAIQLPALLVYGDADSIPPSHAAEFFALLGGGLRDAGWNGELRTDKRLAILSGRTHYDILEDSTLPTVLEEFLA